MDYPSYDSDCDNELDYETADEDGPGPSKRQKLCNSKAKSGAALYKTKYQKCWQQRWPFAVAVKDNPYAFRCTVCNKVISCSHQGERDVSRHADAANHKHNIEIIKKNQRLSFRSTADSQSAQEKVS